MTGSRAEWIREFVFGEFDRWNVSRDLSSSTGSR